MTDVSIDAVDGCELAVVLPVVHNALDRADASSDAIHEVMLWGMPFRIAVLVFGLLMTPLPVIGVLFWMQKLDERLANRW